MYHSSTNLELAGIDDGRRVLVLDGTSVATAGLDGADNAHRLDIVLGNLSENDVLSVQPGGDDGGDEELRSVATPRYKLWSYEAV